MTSLYGITGSGYMYSLRTDNHTWHCVPDIAPSPSTTVQGIKETPRGFKRVVATPLALWALGCDHQVYVYVLPADVPVRCQEETYENEVSTLMIQSLSSHF